MTGKIVEVRAYQRNPHQVKQFKVKGHKVKTYRRHLPGEAPKKSRGSTI